MRLNNLIESLQQLQFTHGDCEVWVYSDEPTEDIADEIIGVRSELNTAVILI